MRGNVSGMRPEAPERHLQASREPVLRCACQVRPVSPENLARGICSRCGMRMRLER
jgi:hypothetical protein